MAYNRRGEIPGQNPDEFKLKIKDKNLTDSTTPRGFLPNVGDFISIDSQHRNDPSFPTLSVRTGTGGIPSVTEFTGVFDATTAIPDPFEALITRIAEQERLRQEALDRLVDRLVAGITSRYQIPYSTDLLDRRIDEKNFTTKLEWDSEERRRAEERETRGRELELTQRQRDEERAARKRELELAERQREEARRIRKIEMEMDERRREREMDLLKPRRQYSTYDLDDLRIR